MPRDPLPSETPIANPQAQLVPGPVLAGPAGLPGGRLAGSRLAGRPGMTGRVETSATPRFDGDDPGSPELRQHVEVEIIRLVEEGAVRSVRRTVDLLAAMLRNGTITGDMAVAGRRFQSSFQAGHIMAGGQSSFLRPPTEQRPAGPRGAGDNALDARQRVGDAITLLGGHGSLPSSAMWFVLGVGLSVKEWARRVRFGQGRALGEEVARGIVIAALAVLASEGPHPRRRGA